jgi:hypothetical protein
MIRVAIVPPALAAALYRLAATLPGATLVPNATSATGRPGIGIMWTGTGELTGESTIVQRAFVARAGQVPS